MGDTDAQWLGRLTVDQQVPASSEGAPFTVFAAFFTSRSESRHGSENQNMFLSCQFLRSYLNSTKAPLRHPIWAEPFQQSWADEATRTTRISRNAFRYLRMLVGLALRATRAPKLTGRPGFPWYLE